MREIQLSKGKVAIIDDCDFDLVAGHPWHVTKHVRKTRTIWYARTCTIVNGIKIYTPMHRMIVGARPEEMVDHRDGNGLNNRRDNLRVCNRMQNKQNAKKTPGTYSKFKGVTWNKNTRIWHGQIRVNRKLKHLGCFADERDAATAYDAAARQYFGEFALTNF